ncbi:MAG: type II/IV secretion system ATPase subunit [Methanoregula sp.]|nr:type II/IV secretion system ATPase subunit [Methanoregula sp.]
MISELFIPAIAFVLLFQSEQVSATITPGIKKESVSLPESVHKPPGKLSEQFRIFPRISASLRSLVAKMGDRTEHGDTILLGVLIVALLSGYAALFVDLPVPALGGLGVVSLFSLGLVATGTRIRFNPDPFGGYEPGHADKKENSRSTDTAPGILPIVTPDPEIPEERTPGILDMYWILPPFSYIKIVRAGNAGFTYTVVEPSITQKEKTILRETYAYLRDVIIFNAAKDSTENHLDPATVTPVIHQFAPALPDDRLDILYYYLKRDLSGYGPLDPLMHDPALEDLSCNGNDLPVFVFHRDYGSLPTSVIFHEGELNQFVLKLAQKANKQISLSNPMMDATLPGGARVQITYSNVVSLRGSSFTIRKFRTEPMTPLDLIRLGTYNAETLAFLWLAIEHRKSLLVVGGTASGKTSTMNAVSLFIPQNAKIVSLEDTHEIQLPHKNWLPTLTREGNAPGVKGDIDLFSLLKACMRQRPEYIIVGEVRGREAQTLFQAMNTGHATLSTIHAGSVQEAINRLTHDPINVPPVMFTALDLVVVQSIYSIGNTRIRRCLSIHEIEVNKSGEITTIPLFEWDIQKDTFRRMADRSRVLAEIAFHRGWTFEETERQVKKREEFFSWALEVEPPDIQDLANAIHDLE